MMSVYLPVLNQFLYARIILENKIQKCHKYLKIYEKIQL